MSDLMSHLVTHPIVNAIAWTLVHFLWQGAIIGGVAALTWRIGHRASPHVRYAIGVAALALMVVSLGVTFAQIVHVNRASVAAATIAQPVRSVALSTAAPNHASAAVVAPPAATVTARDGALFTTGRSASWLACFFLLWTAGVGVSFVRLAGGWMYALRLTRRGVAPVAADLAVLAHRVKVRLGLHRAVRFLESSLDGVASRAHGA